MIPLRQAAWSYAGAVFFPRQELRILQSKISQSLEQLVNPRVDLRVLDAAAYLSQFGKDNVRKRVYLDCSQVSNVSQECRLIEAHAPSS